MTENSQKSAQGSLFAFLNEATIDPENQKGDSQFMPVAQDARRGLLKDDFTKTIF